MVKAYRFRRIALASLVVLGMAAGARAQLDEHCTVTVLNRTVQVGRDGSWQLPTVPATFGRVKARATCVEEGGITRFGESEFFEIPNGGVVTLPYIVLGAIHPIPASLVLSAPQTSMTA